MSTPTITFRAPKNLQNQAKKKAASLGIPLSIILQQALKTFIKQNSITFTDNGFSPEFENLIIEAEKDNRYTEFNDTNSVISHLENL